MNILMNAFKYRFLILCGAVALITVVPVFVTAQDDPFKNISHRFEQYNHAVQEKLYLHTDKNSYLAGEIIWFKLYYVDAARQQATDLSKVAYVEILDRTHKPVLQAKIALTEKGGSGSFYLPLTINTDNYTIRAYTNWMKNMGPGSFFEKAVSVVNTIKTTEKKMQELPKVTANFFPEGGNLVQGIETKLAFHIVDQNGRGINATGYITDNNGDTIQYFSPQHFGIGSFVIKPIAGHQYKAIVTLPDGGSFTSSLPSVYESGFVMNITDNKDGRLKVRVQAKGTDPGQRGEKVFLLGHSHQVTKVAEPGFVNYESDLVLYIDKTKLSEGVNHFTLFNKDQQPVCERLVFKRPPNKISTNISTDKILYEQRKKVDLAVSSPIENSTSNSSYSVSVFQIDSLDNFYEDDIASYLWLSSDLRGYIESPAFYFSNEGGVDEATDNLLLTHGWRRFRWEKILSARNETPVFIPEYGGHLVTAKVTNLADGKAAAGVNCFLSYQSNPFGFVIAKTDSKGIVYFNIKDYYGPGEIIVQPGGEAPGNYRVDILTPFSEEALLRQPSLLAVAKKDEEKLTGKSIAMQAQNIYVADSIRRFMPPVMADTFPFFGKAEYIYPLDEYKRFTTMEEVLREYVTPINVVMRNGKLHMSIYDEVSQTVYSDHILVLLDGVPLTDYNRVFSYDPLKVKKLAVVPRRFLLGGMNFKGIASFETYQGKFDGFELIPGVVAVDYEGLQLQREFFSPSYENDNERQKRIPDLRSTLYWTPDVSVDNSGKASLQFYTSDQQGRFMVVLQGLNDKGEPVSVMSSFTVK